MTAAPEPQARHRRVNVIPVRERITCSVQDAIDATGFGKTKFFELIASGRIATIKIDGRRLVQVRSLVELLESLSTNQSTHISRLRANHPEPRRTKKSRLTASSQ